MRDRADAFDIANGHQPETAGRLAPDTGRGEVGRGEVGQEKTRVRDQNETASGSGGSRGIHSRRSRRPDQEMEAPPTEHVPRPRIRRVIDDDPAAMPLQTTTRPMDSSTDRGPSIRSVHAIPESPRRVNVGPDGVTRELGSHPSRQPDIPRVRSSARVVHGRDNSPARRSANMPKPSTRAADPIDTAGRSHTPTYASLEKAAIEANGPEGGRATEENDDKNDSEEVICETICDRCDLKNLRCTRKVRRNACDPCTAGKFKCSNVPKSEVPKGKRKATMIEDDEVEMPSTFIDDLGGLYTYFVYKRAPQEDEDFGREESFREISDKTTLGCRKIQN